MLLIIILLRRSSTAELRNVELGRFEQKYDYSKILEFTWVSEPFHVFWWRNDFEMGKFVLGWTIRMNVKALCMTFNMFVTLPLMLSFQLNEDMHDTDDSSATRDGLYPTPVSRHTLISKPYQNQKTFLEWLYQIHFTILNVL